MKALDTSLTILGSTKMEELGRRCALRKVVTIDGRCVFFHLLLCCLPFRLSLPLGTLLEEQESNAQSELGQQDFLS